MLASSTRHFPLTLAQKLNQYGGMGQSVERHAPKEYHGVTLGVIACVGAELTGTLCDELEMEMALASPTRTLTERKSD